MTAMKAPSKSVLCLAVFCSLFAAFTVLADDIPSQDISTVCRDLRVRWFEIIPEYIESNKHLEDHLLKPKLCEELFVYWFNSYTLTHCKLGMDRNLERMIKQLHALGRPSLAAIFEARMDRLKVNRLCPKRQRPTAGPDDE
ncbi:hypothetical protein TYRP_020573 [Tyrophagus putrescentiae]|nr:hypothetical protein TYRP_020573 [Tyrophagus putrescentiae]